MMVRAYTYIRELGATGLRQVSELATNVIVSGRL
jgi:glycine cleavage system protein P-like pyridoxal-binding family